MLLLLHLRLVLLLLHLRLVLLRLLFDCSREPLVLLLQPRVEFHRQLVHAIEPFHLTPQLLELTASGRGHLPSPQQLGVLVHRGVDDRFPDPAHRLPQPLAPTSADRVPVRIDALHCQRKHGHRHHHARQVQRHYQRAIRQYRGPLQRDGPERLEHAGERGNRLAREVHQSPSPHQPDMHQVRHDGHEQHEQKGLAPGLRAGFHRVGQHPEREDGRHRQAELALVPEPHSGREVPHATLLSPIQGVGKHNSQ